MARFNTVSDEDILERARGVFSRRGHEARTREIAAAVGLTWGAIILRFQDKRTLFDKAMAPSSATLPTPGEGGLPALLALVHGHLRRQWPLQLHRRLASLDGEAGFGPLREALAGELRAQAGMGRIREDLDPTVLAELLLTLMTGDIARRFVEARTALAPDPALIEQLMRLLSPRPNPRA